MKHYHTLHPGLFAVAVCAVLALSCPITALGNARLTPILPESYSADKEDAPTTGLRVLGGAGVMEKAAAGSKLVFQVVDASHAIKSIKVLNPDSKDITKKAIVPIQNNKRNKNIYKFIVQFDDLGEYIIEVTNGAGKTSAFSLYLRENSDSSLF